MPYTRASISSLMVPNQNSVVFHCKTTMWSCLSGTTCSHVCSGTRSCFGACYRSSSPEILAISSRQFVLQTFFPDMPMSEVSCYQPDLNLRQIWWLEKSPTFAFCSQLAPPCANFPWDALLSSCCPRSSSKVDLPWVPSISGDKQKSSIALSSKR